MGSSTAKGPFGALLAVVTLDINIHGVTARTVSSGRASADTYGNGRLTVYYLDGKRTSRDVALKRLSAHIAEGEEHTFTGAMQL